MFLTFTPNPTRSHRLGLLQSAYSFLGVGVSYPRSQHLSLSCLDQRLTTGRDGQPGNAGPSIPDSQSAWTSSSPAAGCVGHRNIRWLPVSLAASGTTVVLCPSFSIQSSKHSPASPLPQDPAHLKGTTPTRLRDNGLVATEWRPSILVRREEETEKEDVC